ncbi:MAG: Diguanylate cyclase protein/HDIG protein [Solirubrobacterales bacterium]|nr:Diguanylate cyclase protein/HDIG protein [Solirubrobacterales bacterium]
MPPPAARSHSALRLRALRSALRLRALRFAVVERMGEAVRWRALGLLFVAGGLLALGTLLLPRAASADPLAVVVVALVASVCGLVQLAVADRLPPGDLSLSLVLAFGTGLVSAGTWATGDPASALALMYVWVGFDAFFFLSRRAAVAHIALVAVAYAVVLVVLPAGDGGSAARWLMTLGTVAVTGTLADILHERSARLIEQLGEVARKDSLTGLLNRRGFEELMELELARATRTEVPVSLLVGDIDHFKAINDTQGHRAGDRVLQEFADLVRATTRAVDGAARIGGEEFALILPATDQHGAFLFAERLRRRVRAEMSREDRTFSISIGVATGLQHGTTADALLHSADQALYLAKHLGRDRSVSYSAEVRSALRQPGGEPAPVEQLTAVLVLAETLDLRDTGTAAHSECVGRYARAIAQELGLEPEHVERIRLAGLLHDIGKIGVSDPVLTKAGPLDAAEWAEVRKHPEFGARILASANLSDLSAWVLAHHERPDGLGYPAGYGGADIQLEARILAVADSYEAMTSDRVYRRGMSPAAAIGELRRHAGTQFDPRVVEAFVVTLERGAGAPGSALALR